MRPGDAQDPFAFFGLTPEVSERELKRAYARMVREHRPDRDPEGFRRVQEAYEAALEFILAREEADDSPPSGAPDEEGTAATPVLDLEMPPVVLEELEHLRTSRERRALLAGSASRFEPLFEPGSLGSLDAFRAELVRVLASFVSPRDLHHALRGLLGLPWHLALLCEAAALAALQTCDASDRERTKAAMRFLSRRMGRLDGLYARRERGALMACLVPFGITFTVVSGLGLFGLIEVDGPTFLLWAGGIFLLSAPISLWLAVGRIPVRQEIVFALTRSGAGFRGFGLVTSRRRYPLRWAEPWKKVIARDDVARLGAMLGEAALGARDWRRLHELRHG